MHTHDTGPWRHEHTFGTELPQAGERRTRGVVALTLLMMVAEIAAGTLFGSMALLADGWHMATHAAALAIAAFAYAYARRHAQDPRFTFGTGKVGALGGFASAVGLAIVALFVFVESAGRLVAPVDIAFDEAIGVAVLGLAVNLASAFLLRHHDHAHDGAHPHAGTLDGATTHAHAHPHAHDHRDHNLRGAYLHVLADALTSVLAIAALCAGKYMGWTFMDAVTGMLGSILIARWSIGLLRDTGSVLLDAEVRPAFRARIAAAIETVNDDRVADLHVWRVGPRHFAAMISVVSHDPQAPEVYKARLAGFDDLAHVTVEVHRCRH